MRKHYVRVFGPGIFLQDRRANKDVEVRAWSIKRAIDVMRWIVRETGDQPHFFRFVTIDEYKDERPWLARYLTGDQSYEEKTYSPMYCINARVVGRDELMKLKEDEWVDSLLQRMDYIRCEKAVVFKGSYEYSAARPYDEAECVLLNIEW